MLPFQKCFLQVHQFNSHTEELCGQQVQNTLRYGTQVFNSVTHMLVKNHLHLACCPDNINDRGFIPSMSIFHRYVVSVWKVKAMLQRESRLMEEQAQNHYRHFIQLKVKTAAINYILFLLYLPLLIFFLVKVFIAWREATASAVSTCCQQGETLTRFQMFKNQGIQI